MSKTDKTRVGVLFGGRSGEHEVSLVSATSVINNLDPQKYDITPIGITKEGKWVSGDAVVELLKAHYKPKTSSVALLPEPYDDAGAHYAPPSVALAIDDTTNIAGRLDVVFVLLHGPYGEDGTVQGLLELAEVPYVGCGVLASSVGMDKVTQKKLFRIAGLRVVPFIACWHESETILPHHIIERAEKLLGYPVFVKPSNMGSSVGISKAKNRAELKKSIAQAALYDRKIIIEKGIEGAREIECAVLGNDHPKASIPGEIIPSNEFYDYDAKYVDGKSEAVIPASISSDLKKEIQKQTIRAFRAIDGEGMSRVDFLLARDGTIYINEINTIPGFTEISMFPKLWKASGTAYPELLDRLIQLAFERHKKRKQLHHSFLPKHSWYTETHAQ